MTGTAFIAIFSSFGFQKLSVMVTCEKFTGSNLVIPDCANAGKAAAAASRIESVDLSSMGLLDRFKKKTKAKFN